jgi:hypothetical protein
MKIDLPAQVPLIKCPPLLTSAPIHWLLGGSGQLVESESLAEIASASGPMKSPVAAFSSERGMSIGEKDWHSCKQRQGEQGLALAVSEKLGSRVSGGRVQGLVPTFSEAYSGDGWDGWDEMGEEKGKWFL